MTGRVRSGVYRFDNNATGQVYIGSAVSLHARRRSHVSALNRKQHGNRHLQNAWNKYGPVMFSYLVLLYCAPKDLLFFEQRSINAVALSYGRNALYNLDMLAGSALGRKHTSETIAKMSVSQRRIAKKGNKRNLTPAQRAELAMRMSITMRGNTFNKGKVIPEHVRAKISAALIGHTHTPEARAKISAKGKGRVPTEQARQNMRANASRHYLGKSHSEATKLAISISKKGQMPWITGRRHTPEAREKMRAAKRNQRYTKGWTEAGEIPSWGVTKGRFREWLTEVTTHE